MKPIPRRIIEKSLAEKGFVKEEGRDHKLWYFFHEGIKTGIRTPISRGSGYRDYPVSLLKRVQAQLRLDSLRQLDELLRCPMNGQQYTELMLNKGEVLPNDT
ncbi:MAG: hypothetical protein WBC88_06010 [Candidatus Zixiibacteriota bacterium]